MMSALSFDENVFKMYYNDALLVGIYYVMACWYV